jgi:hypothetical protein
MSKYAQNKIVGEVFSIICNVSDLDVVGNAESKKSRPIEAKDVFSQEEKKWLMNEGELSLGTSVGGDVGDGVIFVRDEGIQGIKD